MSPFRESTPRHRADRETCEHYTSYRATLREDFNERCGYCDDSDKLKFRSFTIDHFVPQNPIDLVHEIPPNDYYNLVYSCSFCNGAKSNKWFTSDPNVHHENDIGFVQPTTEDYTNLFVRLPDGSIESSGINNTLANHIISELHLFLAIHRMTWKLEKLRVLWEDIRNNVGAQESQKVNEVAIEIADLMQNLFVEVNG